jgi:16S rRNA (guanine527-N7)-methyltransferase
MEQMLVMWRQQILEVSNDWNMTLTEPQVSLILQFLELLHFWNKKHNLTRIKSEDYVKKHIFDSLGLCSVLNGQDFLDVGSGAGFPGIPLAIVNNNSRAFLLDVAQKRCCFLKQVVSELGLNNVEVIETPVENYHPKGLFKVVVTRAFASLEKTVKLTKHVLSGDGVIWCMKAQISQEELAEVQCRYDIVSQQSYDKDTTRCLVKLQPFVVK